MKSKVNGKVSNLTQEVQKLNTKFKLLMSYLGLGLGNSLSERLIALERQCWTNAQYSRRECLKITGSFSSVGDNDLEVACKAMTKAEVDINADDIEDCRRVLKKDQGLIKFDNRKVSIQVLSVIKDPEKVKLKYIDLTGKKYTLNQSESVPLLQHVMGKTKTLYQKGKIDSFYVPNGNIKIRL